MGNKEKADEQGTTREESSIDYANFEEGEGNSAENIGEGQPLDKDSTTRTVWSWTGM